MRIGLFTDTYLPEINGVANSTGILCSILKEHGHTVYVVCPGKNKKPQWNEDGTVLHIPGVELPFLYGYVMASPFHRSLIREIARLHLDLIHVQTEFGIGLFARTCAKQLAIPIVSTYHTTWEDYTHYFNPMHLKAVEKAGRRSIAWYSKLVTDPVKEVIAPSNKTKQLLEHYGINKTINVIPTGLNLSKFAAELREEDAVKARRQELGYSENDRILIYVGRLAEEKDLDMVISGVRMAVEAGADLKLLIVGGGPDLERLQNLVQQNNLTSYIQLTGPKPIDEVPAIYASADAFVSASLSETQGMTFIEALASGLPLFARPDDVLDDLLIPDKTGWFFNSAADLKDKLMAFEKMTKEQLDGMKDDSLARVRPYSNEVFYERMIAVYQRVCESERYVPEGNGSPRK